MTIAERAASDIARLVRQGGVSPFMLEFEIARIVEDAIEDASEGFWSFEPDVKDDAA